MQSLGDCAFLGFIAARFSRDSLLFLFQSANRCYALYRMMSALQQTVVLRLLWLPEPISFEMVKGWFSASDEYLGALSALKRCQLLQGKENSVWLLECFKNGLRSVFTAPQQDAPVFAAEEQKFAESFDEILRFLACSSAGCRPKDRAASLLVSCGLVTKELVITNSGFQFLLQERSVQFLTLVMQLLALIASEEESLETLCCLVSVSLLAPGSRIPLRDRRYASAFPFLESIGLCTVHDSFALCTPSLPHLWFNSVSEDQKSDSGFLILETNYKIYAYTSNPLHLSILELFCEIRGSFPNMSYGYLTQESVRGAYVKGITSAQLLSYLEKHLHPVSTQKVPPTIADQIRLWELERNRVCCQGVFLYKDFSSLSEYEACVAYLKKIDGYVMSSGQQKILIGASHSHDRFRSFLKEKSQL